MSARANVGSVFIMVGPVCPAKGMWIQRLAMSAKRNGLPRRCATCRCRASRCSRLSSQAVQRTANGSARSRRSKISASHSAQSPYSPASSRASASSMRTRSLGPHLDQRELEVVLDVGLGVLARVEDLGRLAGAHVVEATLNVALCLAPAVLQHLPQARVPHAGSRRPGGRHGDASPFGHARFRVTRRSIPESLKGVCSLVNTGVFGGARGREACLRRASQGRRAPARAGRPKPAAWRPHARRRRSIPRR